MFLFLFSIIPFLDLFYNDYVLLPSAKLAESLLWIPTSWCHLIPIRLLDFSPPPFLAPSGSSVWTDTQSHSHTPRSTCSLSLTISRTQASIFTPSLTASPYHLHSLSPTHTLVYNNPTPEQSSSLPQPPTRIPSHSRPGTPPTSIPSCTVSFSPIYTHSPKSARSQSHSH